MTVETIPCIMIIERGPNVTGAAGHAIALDHREQIFVQLQSGVMGVGMQAEFAIETAKTFSAQLELATLRAELFVQKADCRNARGPIASLEPPRTRDGLSSEERDQLRGIYRDIKSHASAIATKLVERGDSTAALNRVLDAIHFLGAAPMVKKH